MNIEVMAKAFKELGHQTRLQVFKRLVKAGMQGLPVGQLQSELSIPGSTLSHHLSSLSSAGLLKQRREGRVLFCVAQFDLLQEVITFLQDECCADES